MGLLSHAQSGEMGMITSYKNPRAWEIIPAILLADGEKSTQNPEKKIVFFSLKLRSSFESAAGSESTHLSRNMAIQKEN